MRIIMTAPVLNVHVLRPINWLMEQGHEVIWMSRIAPRPGEYAFQYVSLPTPGEQSWLASRKWFFGRHLADWLAGRRLAALFKRLQPDLVHAHWVNRQAYHCTLAGTTPVVLSVWGSEINRLYLPEASRSVRRDVGHALARANLVITEVPEIAAKCSEIAGRPIRNTLFMRGVDLSVFHTQPPEVSVRWRQRLEIPANSVVFFSARAWGAVYRHEMILEAFAHALSNSGKLAHLVFTLYHPERGSQQYRNYETNVRRRVEELGVSDYVRWIEPGTPEELAEAYGAADAVVNYPCADSFPITFLEAAACQCAVISGKLPSYAGTFAETYFRMVSSEDAAELCVAIKETIQMDLVSRRQNVVCAREKIEQSYDERNSAHQLVEIYSRVCDQWSHRC